MPRVRFIPAHYILALTRAETIELIVALSVLERDYETTEVLNEILAVLRDAYSGDLPQSTQPLPPDDNEGGSPLGV